VFIVSKRPRHADTFTRAAVAGPARAGHWWEGESINDIEFADIHYAPVKNHYKMTKKCAISFTEFIS